MVFWLLRFVQLIRNQPVQPLPERRMVSRPFPFLAVLLTRPAQSVAPPYSYCSSWLGCQPFFCSQPFGSWQLLGAERETSHRGHKYKTTRNSIPAEMGVVAQP